MKKLLAGLLTFVSTLAFAVPSATPAPGVQLNVANSFTQPLSATSGAGNTGFVLQSYTASPNNTAGLYFAGAGAASGTNFTLVQSANSITLNGLAGSISFRIGNATGSLFDGTHWTFGSEAACTFTVCINGTLQLNGVTITTGTSGGVLGFLYTANTISGVETHTADIIDSTAGLASAPPLSLTGAWFSGGTTTTTKPQYLIEASGAISTAWNVSGTGLGINGPTGFSGLLQDNQVNGVSKATLSSGGTWTANAYKASTIGSLGSSAVAISASGTGLYSLVSSSDLSVQVNSLAVASFNPNGHLALKSTTAPTISGTGCAAGTTPAPTDARGSITSTAATACTVTFGVAYTTTPACTVSPSASTAIGLSSISTTALVTAMVALTGTIYYTCIQ